MNCIMNQELVSWITASGGCMTVFFGGIGIGAILYGLGKLLHG
jgi:hypothetical protein